MSPMIRATSFPERGATLMPWRLASLMNLGLAKALRKPSCKALNRSGGVPGGTAYRRENAPTLDQEIGKLLLVGAEGQVLQGHHAGRRFRPRPCPDGQERPDGAVLDEVAVTVLNEVEGQVHALQLFPFQCREDAGGALVSEDDLDVEPKRTLEFTHDGQPTGPRRLPRRRGALSCCSGPRAYGSAGRPEPTAPLAGPEGKDRPATCISRGRI